MSKPASRTPRRRRASDDVIQLAERSAPDEFGANDGVDLAQLWAAVRAHSGFVWGLATVLFLVVMAQTMLSSMTFRSAGRLYLGELELRSRMATGNAAQLDISGAGQGDIGSEIEILKSQSLVTQAILDSGLNVSISPVGWRAPRFWQWVLGGRNPLQVDIPQREISAVETALEHDSSGAHTYQVHFLTATDYEVSGESPKGGGEAILGQGKLNKPLVLPGLRMRLMAGTERAPLPDARYNMLVNPLDSTTDAVLGALNVTAPKTPTQAADGAKVLTLDFTSTSPHSAATFLRVLMSGYLGERQTWKTEDASAAETFVTEQLHTLRDSLDTTQKRLADYRSNTRVVLHENEANAMIQQVGKYEEQRVEARLHVAALQDIKRQLKLPNPPSEAFLFGEAHDTVLEGLSSTLATSRNEYSDVLQQYGENAPQTLQVRMQVAAQLETIRNYVNNRLARAQESLSELNRIISQFEDKLKTVPGAEFGLAQLGRESEVYSRVYSYMLERQQQAAILKASTVSKNRILDHPQVPYREDAPKLGLRLASFPVALLFAALLVILHRLFASSFQSESEVRRTVGSLPIFASVPLRVERPRREQVSGEKQSIDPFSDPANPAFAEAFRTLRANLYQEVQSDQGQVVLLTSPTPGDGKTTCTLALAGILVADGRSVLVIDADLRKPSHDDLTSSPSRQGLREILAGLCRWEDVISPVALSVGEFDSVGAGQKGPAELLSGERMTRLLADLRRRYDFILLDCASFPIVADPLVLSTVSDCVMSVFRLRNTPQKLAGEHVRRLSVAALNYGIVVNDTNQLGSVYPLRAKPSIFEGLLDRFDEVRNAKTGNGIRTSTWLIGLLLIVAVAGVAAVLSRRSQIPVLPAVAPAVPEAAAAPSRPQMPVVSTQRPAILGGEPSPPPTGAPAPGATIAGPAPVAPGPGAATAGTAPGAPAAEPAERVGRRGQGEPAPPPYEAPELAAPAQKLAAPAQQGVAPAAPTGHQPPRRPKATSLGRHLPAMSEPAQAGPTLPINPY